MSAAPSLVVTPLCRHFGADRETALTLCDGVERWRGVALEALGARLKTPLDWREDPGFEPERYELGAGHAALRLLAVYAQRTDVDLPDRLPARLELDAVWNAAEREGFRSSHYGHLLAGDCWLPGSFDFTFRAPRPDGEDWTFGSLAAFKDQLHFLDARTFASTATAREAWAAEQLPADAPFVALARRALAVARLAAARADALGLPLVLTDRAATAA